MTDVDYARINVPGDKPREEFTYAERRADLLALIREAGTPAALNQTRLAGLYGVTQPQISQDLDRLGEYIADNLGERRELAGDAVFRRAVRGLLDDEDWRGAVEAQRRYSEWLDRRETVRRLDRKLDLLLDALPTDATPDIEGNPDGEFSGSNARSPIAENALQMGQPIEIVTDGDTLATVHPDPDGDGDEALPPTCDSREDSEDE